MTTVVLEDERVLEAAAPLRNLREVVLVDLEVDLERKSPILEPIRLATVMEEKVSRYVFERGGATYSAYGAQFLRVLR